MSCAFFLLSCGDDEEMQYANIYFPLSAWASNSDFFFAYFDFG